MSKVALGFPFSKTNYILLVIGILLIFIGFVLMTGGASTNPDTFSEAIYSTQRLTVAPLFVLAGLVVEVIAVMYRKKDELEA